MEGETALAAAGAAAAIVRGSGGVRVVARICAPADAATTTAAAPAANSFQVSATRGGSHPRSSDAAALLSFTAAAAPSSSSSSSSSSSQGRASNPRKEEHRLDWCYLQHETNRHVFLNEVKPLIHHLLGGTSCSNACVVTCGEATAKDHLFIGSQDQPALVSMAMEEILEFSKSVAGAVRVSSYQVVQDTHIFDLLEPKDQEVLILEDAQGRTHMKGLSKVHVKSIEDFAQLSCFDSHHNKQPTKVSTQLHTRGHQGLIISISSFDQEGKECAVAKMNFLNLTGYVDPKQKNNGGATALSNSNKSMYALMNVVQALNSNQSFVPYRQSKVTRILQDSLCKTNGAVLIACLDEVCCQDTVCTLSLAARSSQVTTEQYRRSTNVTSSKRPNVNLSANAKNSSRPFLPSIHQPNSVVQKHDRPQWNNSAVKACRTPIANKRSQPIMHSAKKTESLISTAITMKQKDAKPTMSLRRSQSIMHPARQSESSLSTSIKMEQKDAKPTMSLRRSQSIMHPARQSESSLSTSIKMKQKDAKPATGGRSQLITCSTKKNESLLSTSIKTKPKDAKPTMGESTMLCPSTNSSKEDALGVVPTAVKEVKEVQSSQDMEIHAPSKDKVQSSQDMEIHAPSKDKVQSSQDMEIHAPSKDKVFDKISDSLDIVSSETQKVVSSSMEEEDYSLSGLHAVSSCTDSGDTCSSSVPDVLVEMTPVKTNKQSPKLSDRLREISNSLKLLSTRPLSIATQKVGMETPQKVGMETPQRVGMEYVQPINIDVLEPKTPATHLKFEQTENPSNSFKARSTGIKKSLVQECLTFLNSANKEELKSLKGIGEKRANCIIELRENSPELFKEIDDLRDIIGMNQTEIKRMMSGIINS